jgi:hypothetical protein
LQQNSPIPIPETNEEFKENGYYIPSPDWVINKRGIYIPLF